MSIQSLELWKISHTIALKNIGEEDSKIKFLFQLPNEIWDTQKKLDDDTIKTKNVVRSSTWKTF